jgi:transposase-like protein
MTVRHSDDVEQLRQRFAEFRQTHAVRSRLPEELWAAAAKLARRDGMSATARALELDQPSLKKWADRFEPAVRRRRGKRSDAPAFVELLTTATPGPATGCRVEVESAQGAKLRLEFASWNGAQLAELLRAFCG